MVGDAASDPQASKVPVAKRTLSQAERGHLVAEIRLAFQQQRAMWEVVRTGVELGAEEVQDQRLRAAETPPEANPALDLFVFFLMWSLEGPLVAGLLGAVRNVMANALARQMRLQSRAYHHVVAGDAAKNLPGLVEARRIAASRTGRAERRSEAARGGGFSREQRARVAKKYAEAAQRELRDLERQVRVRRGGLRNTALALSGMRVENLPDYIVALPNVALGQWDPGKTAGVTTQPTSLAGLSPGVTVRAQVEKQAREMIQESYFQQEHIELLCLDPTLTIGQAAEIFEDIGPVTPVDLGRLSDYFQLVAAALIWSMLLGTLQLRVRRVAEQDASRRIATRFAKEPDQPYGRLFTAPEQHRDYLVARFGAAAEAWARDTPQSVLMPGPYPRRPGSAPPQEVEAYIAAGHDAGPQTLSDRISDVMGLRVSGAEVRLDLVLQWLGWLAEQSPDSLLRPPGR
ncbi:hypothetical protein ACWEFL_32520 [Streptomyces sp. NPDC004838]